MSNRHKHMKSAHAADVVFIYIEDRNNKWMDINVFHHSSVTTGSEVRIQTPLRSVAWWSLQTDSY